MFPPPGAWLIGLRDLSLVVLWTAFYRVGCREGTGLIARRETDMAGLLPGHAVCIMRRCDYRAV
jgi:hypothetical protein